MSNVTVYSTPTCVYCKMTKEFFDEHDVAYTDVDVSQDQEAAQKMMDKSGQMGVPVIVVKGDDDNEEVIVGFQKDKLADLLNIET